MTRERARVLSGLALAVLLWTAGVACSSKDKTSSPSALPTTAVTTIASAATASPAPTATTPPAATAVPGATAAPAPTFAAKLSGKALADALRSGGYALVIRHSLTDPSTVDDPPTDPRDCSRQRVLNAAGREQARLLGAGIEALAIPHAVVLVSPYCRVRDTAGLAFGNYDPAFELSAFVNTDPTTNINGFRALIARKPPQGTNYIYVTHVTNIAAVDLPTVVEGTTVVIQPDGTNWTTIAVIAANEWANLK